MKCNLKKLITFFRQQNALCSSKWYEEVVYDCMQQVYDNRVPGRMRDEYSEIFVSENDVFEQERQVIYTTFLNIFRNVKVSSHRKAKNIAFIRQCIELQNLNEEKQNLRFWQLKKYIRLKNQIKLKEKADFVNVMFVLQNCYENKVCDKQEDFFKLCVKTADRWFDV